MCNSSLTMRHYCFVLQSTSNGLEKFCAGNLSAQVAGSGIPNHHILIASFYAADNRILLPAARA